MGTRTKLKKTRGLKIWNEDINLAVKEKKQAYIVYLQNMMKKAGEDTKSKETQLKR